MQFRYRKLFSYKSRTGVQCKQSVWVNCASTATSQDMGDTFHQLVLKVLMLPLEILPMACDEGPVEREERVVSPDVNGYKQAILEGFFSGRHNSRASMPIS